MKTMSSKEFYAAPRLVQFIYMNAACDTPMGASILEEGYTKHPEYFPEEVEHRRRWATIPQEAHDAYHADMRAIWDKAYTIEPTCETGIFAWINSPDGLAGFSERMDAHRAAVEAAGLGSDAEQAIYEKHYGKYMND